ANLSGPAAFGIIQAAAPSHRVEVNAINMRDAGEIERAVAALARAPNGGLILTGSGLANVHGRLIIKLAARHNLPAIYYEGSYVAAGGLISYGPDYVEQFRQASGYPSRILKQQKPAHLPAPPPTTHH